MYNNGNSNLASAGRACVACAEVILEGDRVTCSLGHTHPLHGSVQRAGLLSKINNLFHTAPGVHVSDVQASPEYLQQQEAGGRDQSRPRDRQHPYA